MNEIFLSLGSNIGVRKNNLSKAVEELKKNNIVIDLESSVYESSPLHNLNQNYFLNKVIKARTSLNPDDLLDRVKFIELSMGRDNKNAHNMPRIIDIDILSFNDIMISSNTLIIPHPRILDRRFILEPWNEITPEYMIKGQNLPIKELYNKYLKNRFKNQKVEIINN